VDHILLGLALGKLAPAYEIVGEEIIVPILVNHLGVTLAQQGKGTADAAYVDRLPQPVQYQYLPVQHGRGKVARKLASDLHGCQRTPSGAGMLLGLKSVSRCVRAQSAVMLILLQLRYQQLHDGKDVTIEAFDLR
jgi:hypothetical protein